MSRSWSRVTIFRSLGFPIQTEVCFLKELRPLANVSIFSVCHVHGHASLFLDRLGFQYKLNGDDRSVPNFCVYVICICVLCCVKSAIL